MLEAANRQLLWVLEENKENLQIDVQTKDNEQKFRIQTQQS